MSTPDTTPDAFSFADVSNVAPGSVQTSNAVILTGTSDPAPLTVAGGAYSIGCSASFTSAPGLISSGQTVCVRHTAASAAATVTSTVLTVGGVSDTFSSTTAATVGLVWDQGNWNAADWH